MQFFPWMTLPPRTSYKWQGGMPDTPSYASGTGVAPQPQDILQQIIGGGFKPPPRQAVHPPTDMPSFTKLEDLLSMLLGTQFTTPRLEGGTPWMGRTQPTWGNPLANAIHGAMLQKQK